MMPLPRTMTFMGKSPGCRSAAEIAAMVAAAEAGQVFVANGAGRLRDGIHRIAWADEIHHRSGPQLVFWRARRIEGDAVHRDASDDRQLNIVEKRAPSIAGAAQEPIGVPYGNRGDPAGCCGAICAAIPDRRALR